ncbi:CelD/BcsL family acetyltransferase involved in cellulose biosynthesis [Azospirillum agricola]|uniref:GNAT family N-acetyltransferase n=1 Tax=Azospirillum agricola TaxID=1720247 RepID=UPI001AE0F29E|nr:GNAT family N-acetyltransferase [Azospirillum agricola]MBP2227755.1 CelD/BcsL family acetyltransferase involved in cellulose biosynthesis [Azospirillum agricola]
MLGFKASSTGRTAALGLAAEGAAAAAAAGEATGEAAWAGAVRIRCFDACEPLRERWEWLEARSDGYAFQSVFWVAALLDTIGRDPSVRPVITLVTDADGKGGEAPALILPLMLRRTHGVATLRFLDFGVTDYNAPLIRADVAWRLSRGGFPDLWRRILAAIGAAAGPVDVVRLEKMPERIGGLPNPLLQLPSSPQDMSYQAPLNGGYDDFLKRRSHGLMADSRAKQRRLSRQGAVEFRIVRDPAEARPLVEAMIAQKSRRYRDTGAEDIFRNPACAAFYHALAADCGEGGRGHVCALTVDGEPVAVHVGMVAGDRFYWLMPAFDGDRFARFSPGRLLLLNLIRWACDRKLAVFDFTIGGERYKLDWTEETMALHAHGAALTARGRLHACGFTLCVNAKTALRTRHPDAFLALKSLQARLLRRPVAE